MNKLLGKKLVLSILMCLTLLLCASCGNKNAGATGATNTTGSEGATGTATEETNTEKVKDVKGPLAIYKIGTDTIAVLLNDPECEKLMPVGEHEESPNRMSLHTEDWNFQIGLSSFYGNISYKVSEDNWENISSPYDKNHVTKDSYFICFSADGICDKLPDSGEIVLTKYNVNDSQEEEFYKEDASKIVQKIDIMQYADLVGKAYEAKKPEGDWAGTYMSDSYSESQGFSEITVTDSGALYIKAKIDGEEREFIAIEAVPEGATDDPKYLFRNGVILNGGNDREYVEFQYSKSYYGEGEEEYDEGISYNYSNYDDGTYKNSWMKRVEEWHKASATYKDEDTVGKITKKDPEDDSYFKPTTDDYIIMAYYDGTYTSEQLSGEQYSLYCFDEMGRTVYGVMKIVMQSEADAKKVYDDRTKYESDTKYKLSGNVVYTLYPDMYYSSAILSKFEAMLQSDAQSNWTYGTHWYTGWVRDDDFVTGQTYISKPYTEEDFNFSIDDMIFWNSLQRNYYPNKANSENTFSADIGKDYLYISNNGTLDGNTSAKPLGEIRIKGRTITGASASREYDYDTQSYSIWLNFTELNFTDTEANLTQYCFKVDNPFDTSVTVDNYKSKTADKTLTATYDLTNPMTY